MDFLTTDFRKVEFLIELYNTYGDTTKHFYSDILFLIYLCFLGSWVFLCFKNRAYVHKIHILMGALLVMVTLDLFYGPADSQCAELISCANKSVVIFYAFKLIRVVLLYTVMVLMCAGWSFLRPFIPLIEKMVLMGVILLNVSSIVIRETNPFHIVDTKTWGCCFVVEIMCVCCLLIPNLCTLRWLDKACKADRKAARSFAKVKQFTWLNEGPTWGLVLCFILGRYVAFCVRIHPDRRYSNKATNVVEEISSLVFCMVLFYMFRPVETNDYRFLDVQEEVAVPQPDKDENNQTGRKTRNRRKRGRKNDPDQVSFSYPKLPQDFEW